MPPQVPVSPPQVPTPPPPAPVVVANPLNRALLWSTVIAVVLLCAAGGYLYYVTQIRDVQLTTQLTNTAGALSKANQQNQQLEQQVAQLTCKGTWSDGTCTPLPATLAAQPSSGKSPLKVKFTATVPDVNYRVDFGDGGSSWITGGANADSAGACTPDQSGLCTITISHTYTISASLPSGTFNAKLMQASTAVSSTTITVTK